MVSPQAASLPPFPSAGWARRQHAALAARPGRPDALGEQTTACPHLKGQLKRYLISLLRISSHFCSSRFWRRAVRLVCRTCPHRDAVNGRGPRRAFALSEQFCSQSSWFLAELFFSLLSLTSCCLRGCRNEVRAFQMQPPPTTNQQQTALPRDLRARPAAAARVAEQEPRAEAPLESLPSSPPSLGGQQASSRRVQRQHGQTKQPENQRRQKESVDSLALPPPSPWQTARRGRGGKHSCCCTDGAEPTMPF